MPDGLILPRGLRLSGGGRRALIPDHPINQGLCLYAPLDEPAGLTAYDLSPWQRHGTLTNVVPSATVGWQNTTRGRALALDGSNDYVSLPQGHFPSGNQPYSFFGKVFWAASGATRKVVTWGRTGVARGGVYIGITSGRLDVSHWAEDWTSTISAPVGEWFGFGVTYNGTQDKVFLNGRLAEAKTLGGALAVDTSLNNAAIGFLFNLNIEYFDGAFRHFRVYNRVLADGEMATLDADPEAGSLSPEERIWVVVPPSGPTVVDLLADDLTAGTPTLGTPALGQIHALGAEGVVAGAPVLGAPALGQVHALAADAVAAGAAVLGAPALGQAHALAADALATGAAVLGTPALGQVHALAADGIVAGAPVLGTPALNAAPVDVPASRTILLPARSRTRTLAARDRTIVLPSRRRTVILPGDRT